MNLTLISSAIAAAIGFGAAWQIQGHFIIKQKLEYTNERIANASAAHAEKERNLTTLVMAQNEAAVRMVVLRRDLGGARTELDRVRSASASSLQASRTDPAACADTANAQAVVLSECAGRLVEVAGNADGHASDTQTMIGAWPK